VLALAERLAPIGSRNAVSDVGVGALLAVTALRGGVLNVRINLPSLNAGDPLRDEAETEATRLLDGLDEREQTIRHHVKEEQDEMFPKVRRTELDLVLVGEAMASRKQELMGTTVPA
jgi:hypothetical protein